MSDLVTQSAVVTGASLRRIVQNRAPEKIGDSKPIEIAVSDLGNGIEPIVSVGRTSCGKTSYDGNIVFLRIEINDSLQKAEFNYEIPSDRDGPGFHFEFTTKTPHYNASREDKLDDSTELPVPLEMFPESNNRSITLARLYYMATQSVLRSLISSID